MTKRTDTQMILLSQASQREDHSLLPVPACIRTSAPPAIATTLTESRRFARAAPKLAHCATIPSPIAVAQRFIAAATAIPAFVHLSDRNGV